MVREHVGILFLALTRSTGLGLGRRILLHNDCGLGHGRSLVGSIRGVNCQTHQLTTSPLNQLGTVS